MKELPVRLINDAILVLADEQKEKTKAGIIVPVDLDSPTGIVVAVGDSEEIKLKVGDRIVIPRQNAGMRIDGVDYIRLEYKDIRVVFTEKGSDE